MVKKRKKTASKSSKKQTKAARVQARSRLAGIVVVLLLIGGYAYSKLAQSPININQIEGVPNPDSSQLALMIVGDDKIEVGDELEVGVLLSSGNVLSEGEVGYGVDVVLKYDSQYLKPVEIVNKGVFPSFTYQEIVPEKQEVRISAITTNPSGGPGTPPPTVNDVVVELDGQTEESVAGEMARVVFEVMKEGTTNVSFEYVDKGVTTDTNVILQKSDGSLVDILSFKPSNLNLYIQKPVVCSAVKKGYCLDGSKTPRCISYVDSCQFARCATPIQKCSISSPIPSPVPSFTPKPSPISQGVEMKLQLVGNVIGSTTGELFASEVVSDISSKRIREIIKFDTDENGIAMVNLPSRMNGKRFVMHVRTQNSLLRQMVGSVVIPTPYKGVECKPVMNESGRLMPVACPQTLVAPRVVVATFTNLILGDLYLPQDNIVNSFDALDMVKNLGVEGIAVSSISGRVLTNKYDLNGDGAVNVRDYKVLLNNYGQHGDEMK